MQITYIFNTSPFLPTPIAQFSLRVCVTTYTLYTFVYCSQLYTRNSYDKLEVYINIGIYRICYTFLATAVDDWIMFIGRFFPRRNKRAGIDVRESTTPIALLLYV